MKIKLRCILFGHAWEPMERSIKVSKHKKIRYVVCTDCGRKKQIKIKHMQGGK